MIDALRGGRSLTEEAAVRLLMRFLFDYEQIRRPVSTLSGGERTRLCFLGLMQDAPNCLVLDEPTNHLDIDSIEVLEDALERFDGTVDRGLPRPLLPRPHRRPDRVVADGEVRSFEGGWSANAGVLGGGLGPRRLLAERSLLEPERDVFASGWSPPPLPRSPLISTAVRMSRSPRPPGGRDDDLDGLVHLAVLEARLG